MTTLDGEEAIDRALQDVYPQATLLRFEGAPGERFQLRGVVAARIETPVPHWVIVSRGFTELEDNEEKANPEVSGWGFELTCRVPATSDEFKAGWIVNWMQGIGEYLAASGALLEPFHHKGMTQAASDDDICGLVFAPVLGPASSKATQGRRSIKVTMGVTPLASVGWIAAR